jgi:hypothetical protein
VVGGNGSIKRKKGFDAENAGGTEKPSTGTSPVHPRNWFERVEGEETLCRQM